MRTAILLAVFSTFLLACNPNPNKEARIQKLETELQVATENISGLESQLKTLETENAGLMVRVKELEAL